AMMMRAHTNVDHDRRQGLCVYPFTFRTQIRCSYFQRAVRTVLEDMKDTEVMTYIDDVLIFSRTFEEHLEILEKVLTRFRKFNLKVSPKKCEFLKSSIVFLGHQINEDNYEPNRANIDAIMNMPTPRNVNELRRFLGMTGFFRKFVEGYAGMTHGLNKLTHKDAEYIWTDEHQAAVDKLKGILTSKPVLSYPDYNRDFHIFTDASGVAFGAVLMQEHPSLPKEYQAIAYASKTLSGAESRRAAVHNELGAIIFALRQFKPYLYGTKIIVHTDHRPLVFLMARHKVNDLLARWLVELQQYEITIMHIDGKKNTIADCISRAKDEVEPLPEEDMEDIIDFPVCMAIHYEANSFTVRGQEDSIDIVKAQMADKELRLVRSSILNTLKDGQRLPNKWLNVMEFIRISRKGALVIHFQGRSRTLIPESIKKLIFQSFHENMAAGGHLGWRKSHEKASRRYFWPEMKADFLSWTTKCLPCQKRRDVHPSKRELQQVVITSAVFEKVGIDLCGPLRESSRKNKYYVNIVDWFSKFVISTAVPDATTDTVTRVILEECILKFGTPAEIVTDNATNFTSADFKSFGKTMGFKHHYAIPHHSRGNGATERTFRTFHDMVAKYIDKSHTDWDAILPCVTSAYNTAVHTTTGESPFYMVFGRDPVFVIDRLIDPTVIDTDKVNPDEWKTHITSTLRKTWKDAAERSRQVQLARQKAANKGAQGTGIQCGDRVLLRNYESKLKQSRKLVNKWLDGYRVTEIKGHEATIEKIGKAEKTKRVHLNQIKKHHILEEKKNKSNEATSEARTFEETTPLVEMEDVAAEEQAQMTEDKTLDANVTSGSTPIAAEEEAVAEEASTTVKDTTQKKKAKKQKKLAMKDKSSESDATTQTTTTTPSGEAEKTEEAPESRYPRRQHRMPSRFL
ncbi:hypothetical protein CAEBREN_20879, partial [Caenorhabditis brenneri]